MIANDATVKSWLPYDGRIEIIPKRAGNISIRVPSWVDERTFNVDVNGDATEVSFLKPSFAQITNVTADHCVTCRFPLRETFTRETVLGTTYEAEWVGDTVMSVSPAGPRVPLYRRARNANHAVPMMERSMTPIEFNL